jgi:hypothetical protein
MWIIIAYDNHYYHESKHNYEEARFKTNGGKY